MRFKLEWKSEREKYMFRGVVLISLVYAFFSIWRVYNWKSYVGLIILLFAFQLAIKDVKIKFKLNQKR